MRSLALAAGAFALAATTIAPGRAEAFCRESACADNVLGSICTPSQPTDCGKPLFWVEPCLGFAVQKNASKQVSFAAASNALGAAFDAWTSAACAGGPPSIRVTDLGAVDCGMVEYNQHAGNANILVFRDDSWPTEEDDVDTLARTTIHYDPDTGQINDADIEVNTANFTFVTDGSAPETGTTGTYDLQATLTHEAGHFLGLAHSPDASATMFYMYSGAHERELAPDDVTAICTVFPPGRKTKDKCTYLPEHGFAPECADEQREGDCSVGGGPSPATITALFAALAGLASRRRSRKPRRS